MSGLAGCSQSGAEARDPERPDFDGFLANANGYGGVVDATDEAVVTVMVGGEDGMSFVPAAVRMDAGSRVRWEWSGAGGTHNVHADDGSFESEYDIEAGSTFEQLFETPGGLMSRRQSRPPRVIVHWTRVGSSPGRQPLAPYRP